MKRALLLSEVALAATLMQSPLAAEEIKPVFRHELPDAAGRELTVVEVSFPPGNQADAHRHGQAFVFAYVLSGAVRSQLAGEPARTYRAGESWFEPPGARHVLTQNLSRTSSARLLVAFVAAPGQPLKTPNMTKGEKSMSSTAKAEVMSTADTPAPQQMVDALYSAFKDNHSRAVHAKGIMVAGTFEPAAEAAQLTKASIFAHGTIPVVARFSDFTGIPKIPDTAGEASPRGFALKFSMSDGTTADIVTHSFNGFPTATSGEFRELLMAIGASGAGSAKPTALDQFLMSHPVAKTFLTTQRPPPESYATLSYFGVNAFRLEDAKGGHRFVRHRFVPAAGEAVLTPARLATMGSDYLQSELPERLAKEPVTFTWFAQIADASDKVDDPSVAWPEGRKLVKLGVVRINRLAADPITADKSTMFAPLNVPAGIEAADPMLAIRQGAYPLSFIHRQ